MLDLSKPIVVNVTQEDIDAGDCHSSMRCPIARAFRRDYGLRISVGWITACINPGKKNAKRFDMSNDASAFVGRHLDGKPPSPGPLTIYQPEVPHA